MKMSEVIDKVSELYRSETRQRSDLIKEYNEVVKKLMTADYNRGENITYAEYEFLKARKIALRQSINEIEKYCDGISAARELLMDLGFDTEVT